MLVSFLQVLVIVQATLNVTIMMPMKGAVKLSSTLDAEGTRTISWLWMSAGTNANDHMHPDLLKYSMNVSAQSLSIHCSRV